AEPTVPIEVSGINLPRPKSWVETRRQNVDNGIAMLDHEQWLQRHERMIAEHDERMAEYERRMEESAERHDREMLEFRQGMAEIRRELGRAVRLSVEESRRERGRRRELDEKITQLAAAQLLTEEKFSQL